MNNVALAFTMTIVAGGATVIGGSVVFSEKLIAFASHKCLAICLAFACGVMLYVSFVELFGESLNNFEESGKSFALSYFLTTFCFFSGIVLLNILERIVHSLNGITHSTEIINPLDSGDIELASHRHGSSSSHDPNTRLIRTAINTCIAVLLHNLPEGLITFFATLKDPKIGLTLAMAVVIHNIPEGICVAVPVYYSTNDRWRAFGYSVLSAVAEPLGALLGYIILYKVLSPDLYGAMFGIVCGMMVGVCLYELFPTAINYDPMNKYVSHSMLGGMIFMAISLCLFAL